MISSYLEPSYSNQFCASCKSDGSSLCLFDQLVSSACKINNLYTICKYFFPSYLQKVQNGPRLPVNRQAVVALNYFCTYCRYFASCPACSVLLSFAAVVFQFDVYKPQLHNKIRTPPVKKKHTALRKCSDVRE